MSGVSVWRFGDDPTVPETFLRRGGFLVVPTESSYGLAADPLDPRGVAAIFALKGRETGNPLPVVLADRRQLTALGVDAEDPAVERVAACWPAALAVVLPLDPAAPALPAAAGERTVAVRVPDHAPLRGLLAAIGPLTATSANRSGEDPVLDPVAAAILVTGYDALVVDGGRLSGGPPSTIVAFGEDGELHLLRPGRVTTADLRRCLAPAC
jgi:L-threonylcarbamoyladenylate synthase